MELLSNRAAHSLARRTLVALSVPWLLSLSACFDDLPSTAEALAEISLHLLTTSPPGEKRVENLTFVSGTKTDEGYEVFVDYDLVSNMDSVGAFSTVTKAGDVLHVAGERYVFVKGQNGWRLQ